LVKVYLPDGAEWTWARVVEVISPTAWVGRLDNHPFDSSYEYGDLITFALVESNSRDWWEPKRRRTGKHLGECAHA
jgi:hypothetical protein